MKARLITALVVTTAGLLFHPGALAQYKAPSQYFPKNSPAPKPGGQPPAPRQTPPAPTQPKFKEVAVNSQFYFQVDTNRVYAWTKISDTTAKNEKNGVTRTINGEMPVQR